MKDLLVVGEWLIDGTGQPSVEKGAVLASGGCIKWVGSVGELPEGMDAEVKDVPGCTILPGLIDAHVHLSMMGGADPWAEMIGDSISRGALKAAHNAKTTLLVGVTTVRDMGSKGGSVIEVARAIEEGLLEGAHVQAAGRAIVMTGGHGYAFGREVDGVDEARKAAREELKMDARVLKVMATGGVLTPGVEPGSAQFTIEEMRAVAEEAHKAGRKVAAHAHGTEGIKDALRAGIDSIEHCSYLDEEGVELFYKTGAYMVSTLIASMLLIRNVDDPRLPEYVVKKIGRHIDHEVASLQMAIRARLKIAAGSDAGSALNPHNQLAKQVALLVKHGMSPMEAIQAATKVSSEVLGRAKEIGTLEKGKVADILVVKGNPLKDINTLEESVAIVKSGKWTAGGKVCYGKDT